MKPVTQFTFLVETEGSLGRAQNKQSQPVSHHLTPTRDWERCE